MGNYNSPKILIVDDEKGLRTGTKRLLEGEGYIVDTAGSGKEGITLGTQNDYDLSIIDLKMPDVDGITVLKEILKVRPNTICIVATGYASYETAIEATKVGAFSYIPKPFTPEELLKKLNEGYYRRQILLEQEKWKKEREERLLEVAFEKTRLNTIINSMTEGLLVVNKNGEAVLFNPSALKFLRLNSIKIEEHIVSRLHPKIATLINKFLLANSFQNKSYSTQLEIDSNQKLFIEATTSPVPHPDGSLAGVVMLIKDITEMKKIEMLKSQFVSMVSHELKAPIAAVSGYLKLLSNNSIALTDEQKKNYIVRSLVRLESLLKMVNDLLDISRMEINTVEREIKKLNLYEIVKSQIELFQFQIKEKNLTVKFETKNNPLTFNADQGDMERLFTNIISNAIKYNKTNGSIEIMMESTNEYLNVIIKDTGIGMKPEEKKKLFQEFFRAKNEKTKNISGTGLGLSIVKRIVDSYAGNIDVFSEFGKGTSVKVSFPLRQ
jgi:PAS domain S-box-containing protein